MEMNPYCFFLHKCNPYQLSSVSPLKEKAFQRFKYLIGERLFCANSNRSFGVLRKNILVFQGSDRYYQFP